ncbi:MAG: hypothetical protein GW795_10745 [Cyanobacteria bacterium]|nr:hypothetical protein [Cyanobacteria bacterium CG_2015-16_32_12]NCO79398.1 hypothetical protein [Cyanobacteria bacterium CG_2015-22_32_23]NCQ42333.1 hypothetical protein [Cyanobacteria bacterium CG_2015-04_32_10]NCS85718.1 hypothetical protein [Cyanobacteria bacterium CG_2015-02_32_10]
MTNNVNNSEIDVKKIIIQIQDILNKLNEVETGTTVYNEAQNLKQFANNKIKELTTKSITQ